MQGYGPEEGRPREPLVGTALCPGNSFQGQSGLEDKSKATSSLDYRA